MAILVKDANSPAFSIEFEFSKNFQAQFGLKGLCILSRFLLRWVVSFKDSGIPQNVMCDLDIHALTITQRVSQLRDDVWENSRPTL